MKPLRTLLPLLVCLLFAGQLSAQKYACINTDYVLQNIPEYNQAKQRIDTYVAQWQVEIEQRQAAIDELRKSYQQEAYLLPDNLKQRRQEEIKEKEQELRELQTKHFGPNGDLDKKREELLKPVQDRIYNTIERVAKEKNYAFVFDKAGSPTLIYANEKYDISDQVLELLGYKPGAARNDNGSGFTSPSNNNGGNNGKSPSTAGKKLKDNNSSLPDRGKKLSNSNGYSADPTIRK